MQERAIRAETLVEAQTAMESAVEAIGAVLSRLESLVPKAAPSTTTQARPTRQQGQSWLSSVNLTGLLGLQVHAGPPMTVDLKNVRIRELK